MNVHRAIPRMTVAEFMDWDGGGHVGKLELVDGVVRAMSPASGTHGIIQANLAYLIGAHLRASNRPCRVGTETPIVPRLRPKHNVRAPDLAVTCEPISDSKTFPDPVLIVEVLSPSNQPETWESIWACATIPGLLEIVVVHSQRLHVEIYRRDSAGAWPKGPDIVATEGEITLTSLAATLAIAEIYAGTHLA